MRLFVAVNPGERFSHELATQLDAWRQQLRIAWSRPRVWHLTLDFLGEWPPERVPALQEALRHETTRHASFAVTCGQVGAFPSLRRPKVLFLHAASDGKLEELVAGLRRCVDDVWPDGPQDRKPFRAHLTFARIKRPLPATQRRLVSEIAFAPWQPFTVADVRLVRSVLEPSGPVYSDLAVCELARGQGRG